MDKQNLPPFTDTELTQDIEFVKKLQKDNRNVESLLGNYYSISDDVAHLKPLIMALTEYVGNRLLTNPIFQVMTLPASLVFNPLKNVVVPVVAKTKHTKALFTVTADTNITDIQLIAHVGDTLVTDYSEMADRIGEGNGNINLYQLIIPCELVSELSTSTGIRYGILTRFAVHVYRNDLHQ